jgi:tetratricopeptide (TPR) repeat protein
MDYLDFDLEIGPGTGRDYPVSVRSPAGQAHSTMRFPFDTLELENALLKLRLALRSSGGVRRKALTESETAVQSFGQKLFEALLADDLRSLFYESKREVARQGRGGLRLRLHIRAAELAALPWEYLYDPRVPDYLCLSKKTPLVRHLDLAHPIEPLTVAPPLRILAMTASPSDQDPLDIEREQERIRRALEPLEQQGQVALTWLAGQTARDLQRALQRGPWHVFHFIGHGDYDARQGEGVLGLCNEQGKTAYLYATQLARLLADHAALRLTILNSCNGARGDQQDVFSSTAATLARFGLPAVLAMQEEISDDAATEWTHAFYEALATGLPVDAAVAEARLAITLSVNNSLEWGTPVLFLRASDGVLFHLRGTAPQQNRPAAQKTREQRLAEGQAHYNARRYEEAAQAFTQALELDINYIAAWNNLGHARYDLKEYEDALKAYNRAIELAPTLLNAWMGKSNALRGLKRYEEALEACEQVIQLDQEYATAYQNKADLLNHLQRYQEALEAVEQAIRLGPASKRSYQHKGNALKGLGRAAEAEEAYRKARGLR